LRDDPTMGARDDATIYWASRGKAVVGGRSRGDTAPRNPDTRPAQCAVSYATQCRLE